jgi:hypothetical protein
MLFSTIGRCAAIQLVLLLPSRPPPAAADQSFRGNRRHGTIDDGCVSFTAKSACLTGTGECTWHPQNGCVSATAMAQSTERVSLSGDEGDKNKDGDEASLSVSRILQNIPPTQNPTTQSPTSKPTSTPSVSRYSASCQFFVCLSRIDVKFVPLLIHGHPSQHRHGQRRGRPHHGQ